MMRAFGIAFGVVLGALSAWSLYVAIVTFAIVVFFAEFFKEIL